jgi:uncharacterized protein (UPF0333 family)
VGKAQASLELLLVFLAFLSAMVFWTGVVNQSTQKLNKAVQSEANSLAVRRLEAAVNSVCLTGPGNSRVLSLYFPRKTVVQGKSSLVVGSEEKKCFCPVQGFLELNGSVVLKVFNQNNVVFFSQVKNKR